MKNMKIKKLVAAALTVASVASITAIPAFADTIGINEKDNSAKTQINIETQASGVRVIVPTSYSMILQGKNECITPNNFIIKNKSDYDLTVKDINFASNGEWSIIKEPNPYDTINSKEIMFKVNDQGTTSLDNGKSEFLEFSQDVNPLIAKAKSDLKLDITAEHGNFSTSEKFDNAFTMTTRYVFK